MVKEHLIEVDGVSKRYGRRKAVDEVSLHVDRGEVVGLFGRNGAGKTTTVRMMMGLIESSTGKIRFQGKPITRAPVYKRSHMGLGFVPQECSLFKRLTVEENLLCHECRTHSLRGSPFEGAVSGLRTGALWSRLREALRRGTP